MEIVSLLCLTMLALIMLNGCSYDATTTATQTYNEGNKICVEGGLHFNFGEGRTQWAGVAICIIEE